MKCLGRKIAEAFVVLAMLNLSVYARIQNSPHDLSSHGGDDPCKFCHTPHGAARGTPGWSRKLSNVVYKIYQSSSLEANVGQPTGASKMCLSCHDGTVALSHSTGGGSARLRPGEANLGTDLSDDHPISFVYSASLSALDFQIRSVSALPEQLKLDKYGEVQCTTCHDVHNNMHGDFLVMPNRRSQMCVSCHRLSGWVNSSHERSPAPTVGTKDTYLKQSRYGTVADNGCQSCHRPHSAGGHERLLHFERSEDNCLNCHDGSVARTNIQAAMAKPSRHNVTRYRGVHDLKESADSAPRHVECVDCHNPHATQDMITQAPTVRGPMQKATGVTASGAATQEVQYEYEVCFKCHADNPSRIESDITRQIIQTNTRLEFDTTNPSHHPVFAAGVNRNVPSLKTPMTISTVIYCTDCHNSDSSSSAKGPHGSSYQNLLAYRYETSDFTQESFSAYELCYQCHSRNSILNDESFDRHLEHLEDEAPCSVCHDPHGISTAQGNTTNNTNLINFDISVVSSDPVSGLLQFEDLGLFHGRCYLKCHDKAHSPESY